MLDSIHLYTAIFGPPVTLVHRSLHVFFDVSHAEKIQPDPAQLV